MTSQTALTSGKRKKLSRQSWLFIFAGIPLGISLIMFINAYMVVNGLIMLIIASGLFITTLRKKNFGIRFTRAAFISFAATFFTIGALVENPALWPSQIERHLFKSTIIQPNSAKIVELESAFAWWLDAWNISFSNGFTYYGDNLEDVSKPLEDEFFEAESRWIAASRLSFSNFTSPDTFTQFQKLVIVDYFIRFMVIYWTEDSTTWDVSDHVPIPDEALSRWHFNEAWKLNPTSLNLQAKDDCDGIAVVTVSFLRRLVSNGYIDGNAFIASGASHWFTAVNVNESTPIVFLNHGDSIHVYGIYTDANTVILGQNVIATLEDTLIVDEETLEEYNFYLGMVMPGYLWIIIIAVVVIGIFAAMLFGYPRDYDVAGEKAYVSEKMAPHASKPKIAKFFIWLFPVKIRNPFGRRHVFFWMNVTFVAAMLLVGFLALFYAILSTPLFPYATIFIYSWLFLTLICLDRDVVVKSFITMHHAVTKRDFTLYHR